VTTAHPPPAMAPAIGRPVRTSTCSFTPPPLPKESTAATDTPASTRRMPTAAPDDAQVNRPPTGSPPDAMNTVRTVAASPVCSSDGGAVAPANRPDR